MTQRYSGFTCPNCGSHLFGSFKWHSVMEGGHYVSIDGRKPASGDLIGTCHGTTGGEERAVTLDCHYRWNREDPTVEDRAMYHRPVNEAWGEFRRRILSPLTGLDSQTGEQK